MTSNISTKLAITLGVLLSTMTTTGFAAANPLKGNPFINSSSYLLSEHGDQDDDKDQDQDCDKDDDKDDDKGNHDDKNNHDGDTGDQDKDDDKDQDNKCVKAPTMRVDCRYHNDKDDDKGKESHGGVRFCYASAVYTPEADEEDGIEYDNVQLGVGCDKQTIYNNSARVHTETVGERISPPTAAFPGVEIFPQGALLKTGTYESVLDIRAGRLPGVCYVHEIEHED